VEQVLKAIKAQQAPVVDVAKVLQPGKALRS
jgi:hypothetical protein